MILLVVSLIMIIYLIYDSYRMDVYNNYKEVIITDKYILHKYTLKTKEVDIGKHYSCYMTMMV